ncbi:MAG: hypothetical protein K0U23_01445 [Gammaproteobacteria bacterium]|nr:hypothetical protein [Gammaproteobacteria bacterium]
MPASPQSPRNRRSPEDQRKAIDVAREVILEPINSIRDRSIKIFKQLLTLDELVNLLISYRRQLDAAENCFTDTAEYKKYQRELQNWQSLVTVGKPALQLMDQLGNLQLSCELKIRSAFESAEFSYYPGKQDAQEARRMLANFRLQVTSFDYGPLSTIDGFDGLREQHAKTYSDLHKKLLAAETKLYRNNPYDQPASPPDTIDIADPEPEDGNDAGQTGAAAADAEYEPSADIVRQAIVTCLAGYRNRIFGSWEILDPRGLYAKAKELESVYRQLPEDKKITRQMLNARYPVNGNSDDQSSINQILNSPRLSLFSWSSSEKTKGYAAVQVACDTAERLSARHP